MLVSVLSPAILGTSREIWVDVVIHPYIQKDHLNVV